MFRTKTAVHLQSKVKRSSAQNVSNLFCYFSSFLCFLFTFTLPTQHHNFYTFFYITLKISGSSVEEKDGTIENTETPSVEPKDTSHKAEPEFAKKNDQMN